VYLTTVRYPITDSRKIEKDRMDGKVHDGEGTEEISGTPQAVTSSHQCRIVTEVVTCHTLLPLSVLLRSYSIC